MGGVGDWDARRLMWMAYKKRPGLMVMTANVGYIYIFIIYTPNLGLEITILVREREQGRFRALLPETAICC